MLKKILLILALVLAIIFARSLFLKRNEQPVGTNEEKEFEGTSNLQTKPAAVNQTQDSVRLEDLEKKDQAEIAKCLGSPARSMEEFKALVESKFRAQNGTILEWKNVHFTNSKGKKFRMRLEREASDDGKGLTRLKMFSVDREGLPDLIKIPEEHMKDPSDQVVRSYLDGKDITLEQEMSVVPIENGEIRIEIENGKPVNIEVGSKAIRIGCTTKFNSPSCRCLSSGI